MIVALIRKLPPWVEFTIVIVLAFGHFIAASILGVFAVPYYDFLPSTTFTQLPIQETIVAIALACFLVVRGWRLIDLGLTRPNIEDLGHAALLLAAVYTATFTLSYFMPRTTHDEELVFAHTDLNIPFVLVFSLINAIFEEVFVCAYVLSAWRGSDMWTAITASAGIRLAYHLYQGPNAVIFIGPLGLIFAWYYATRGRLWPLIAAHALLDVLYLLP